MTARTLPQEQIIDWLNYWKHGQMVSIDAIRHFDQVAIARTFCQCMRVGIFADVSDVEIWMALCAMREA